MMSINSRSVTVWMHLKCAHFFGVCLALKHLHFKRSLKHPNIFTMEHSCVPGCIICGHLTLGSWGGLSHPGRLSSVEPR